MKTLILAALLAFSVASAQEENAAVENASGLHIGLLGMYGHYEMRLSDQWALRAEAGFDVGFAIGWDDEDVYGLIPTFRLEPRWYYNLPKRMAKGYSTDDNAGNFLALNTSYIPDVFIGSNPDGLTVLHEFLVIPKWGIRRNLGSQFNYEAGIGIGYAKYREEYMGDKSGVYPDLHLRIGFRF